MGLFEIFIAVLLCLVLAIIVVTLFIALSGNTEVGGRIRHRLAEHIRELPFYRMLQRRKVDPDQYLRQTPVDDLEKETLNCEKCPNLRRCEETLSQPETSNPDYSFCPNDPAISVAEKNKPGR